MFNEMDELTNKFYKQADEFIFKLKVKEKNTLNFLPIKDTDSPEIKAIKYQNEVSNLIFNSILRK